MQPRVAVTLYIRCRQPQTLVGRLPQFSIAVNYKLAKMGMENSFQQRPMIGWRRKAVPIKQGSRRCPVGYVGHNGV
jgi:hypothetical protein